MNEEKTNSLQPLTEEQIDNILDFLFSKGFIPCRGMREIVKIVEIVHGIGERK